MANLTIFIFVGSIVYSPPVTNIAMENGPFEDVFPIKNGDIPAKYVGLPEGSPLFTANHQGFDYRSACILSADSKRCWKKNTLKFS